MALEPLLLLEVEQAYAWPGIEPTLKAKSHRETTSYLTGWLSLREGNPGSLGGGFEQGKTGFCVANFRCDRRRLRYSPLCDPCSTVRWLNDGVGSLRGGDIFLN